MALLYEKIHVCRERVRLVVKEGYITNSSTSSVLNADWDQFDPHAYIEHNYTSVILPEDKEVLKHLIRRIRELVPEPYGMHRVLNVGHGGVFMADAVVQYLIKESGTYDLIEFGERNLTLMHDSIMKGLSGDNGIWDKFERFAGEQCSVFEGGLQRAWKLANTVEGSIYELPPARYNAGFTFYCPESITNNLAEFEAATRAFVGSVKEGGLVVMAFIRGSEGYDTAGRYFPAVSVDCDDVRNLLSPCVQQLEVVTIDAPRGARPAEGPQYAGMGLASGIRC